VTIDVADIALLRRNHRSDDAFLQRCYTCYQKWPCITSELLDAYEERDRLRAEREIPEGMEEIIEWARRHPEYMWQENQRNENEVTWLETEREQLRAALAEQGLLQKKPGGGMVWHAHDCPASFDFAQCNYRCRVARAALEGRE
jgi:hypothetical protein